MDNEFYMFVGCVILFVLYLCMFVASVIVPQEDTNKAEPIAAWDTNPVVIPIPSWA